MFARFLFFPVIFATLSLFLFLAPLSHSKSALSPRHSGLEPPGEPKQLDILPGPGMSRTPNGGMGYTDAYGNSLDDLKPQEKAPRKRPRPGAFSNIPAPKEPQQAPESALKSGPPLWTYD